jgi:hypothetical protein
MAKSQRPVVMDKLSSSVCIIRHMVGTIYMSNAWDLLKVPKGIGTTQLHGICMKSYTLR